MKQRSVPTTCQSFMCLRPVVIVVLLLALVIAASGCQMIAGLLGFSTKTTTLPSATSQSSQSLQSSQSSQSSQSTQTSQPSQSSQMTLPPETSQTAPSTTTKTTTATTTTKTTTKTTTTAGESGQYLGFVRGTKAATSNNGGTIIIDYVEMYTGDEAIEKALEDDSDVVETDEHGKKYIPNDYYIRNNNPRLRVYDLTRNCKIQMVNMDGASDHLTTVTFKKFVSMNEDYQRLMHITLKNGMITAMKEQYLP